MIEILVEQINDLKREIERKQKALEKDVEQYKEWVAKASIYYLVCGSNATERFKEQYTTIQAKTEELDRLNYMLNKIKEQ